MQAADMTKAAWEEWVVAWVEETWVEWEVAATAWVAWAEWAVAAWAVAAWAEWEVCPMSSPDLRKLDIANLGCTSFTAHCGIAFLINKTRESQWDEGTS